MTRYLDQIPLYLTDPLVLLGLFVAASLLMIWRLNAMERKGFEGTLLGTLIMPYCSGFANLVFAFVVGRAGGNGALVIENSIVNNVTNLTLILGLAAMLCVTGAVASSKPRQRKAGPGARAHPATRLDRLNLLFTLIALFLFTGACWALAKDGMLDRYDGLVLVGLFVFWQILHVFEILKNNIRKNQGFHWSLVIDLLLIGVSAYCIYLSVDHLVEWVTKAEHRYFSLANLGWLSGLLMVVPNALLALYYAHIGRQDIVVSSQIGDGHICIPMCIGLFALFQPIQVPAFFPTGLYFILGAGAVHFLCIAVCGRLPRVVGGGLLGAYAWFLYLDIAR